MRYFICFLFLFSLPISADWKDAYYKPGKYAFSALQCDVQKVKADCKSGLISFEQAYKILKAESEKGSVQARETLYQICILKKEAVSATLILAASLLQDDAWAYFEKGKKSANSTMGRAASLGHKDATAIMNKHFGNPRAIVLAFLDEVALKLDERYGTQNSGIKHLKGKVKQQAKKSAKATKEAKISVIEAQAGELFDAFVQKFQDLCYGQPLKDLYDVYWNEEIPLSQKQEDAIVFLLKGNRDRSDLLLQKAADLGVVDACIEYASILLKQDKKAYVRALPYFIVAAKQGNASAQNNAGGFLYKKQKKCAQFDMVPVMFIVQAAENGHLNSITLLGELCRLGYKNLVKPNYERAMACFNYVLEQDPSHQDALLGRGFLYRDGLGVVADKKSALEDFLKAANKGHARCFCYAAHLLEEDNLNGINDEKIIAYYSQAFSKGKIDAGIDLASFYLKRRDTDSVQKGLVILEGLAEKGILLAHFRLGYYYANLDPQTSESLEKVGYHYDIASEGIKEAAYNLAILYDKGKFGEENKGEAELYMKKAAHLGDCDAMLWLIEHYLKGNFYDAAEEWFEKGVQKKDKLIIELFELYQEFKKDFQKGGSTAVSLQEVLARMEDGNYNYKQKYIDLWVDYAEKKAQEEDNDEMMLELAEFYLKKEDKDALRQGKKWLKKAVDCANESAVELLSVLEEIEKDSLKRVSIQDVLFALASDAYNYREKYEALKKQKEQISISEIWQDTLKKATLGELQAFLNSPAISLFERASR